MSKQISSVTAVTENFPDGQKITAAELEFSPSLPSGICAEDFRVVGRTITEMTVEGRSVVLHLDPADADAPVLFQPPRMVSKPEAPVKEKRSGPPRDLPPAVRRPVQVTVVWEGTAYVSDHSREPVVDQFRQFELNGMAYNLFIPKLEKGKTYPLVQYIHDAGPCGPDPKLTLSQGYGAIGFAEASWQKEHPCFVLAPQVDRDNARGPMTNDEFEVTDDFLRVKSILEYVIANYPVDWKRIYTTGQSMGCMSSCEFNIRYPNLFAASLLVAGQWSPEKMAARCPDAKLWILVSEHDAKAFPGMNAVTEAMERNGAKVARYRWDGKADSRELSKLAREAMQDDANVRYTVFNGSTVVPEGVDPNPGANHINTWPVAYSIRGLKEWLFSNSR